MEKGQLRCDANISVRIKGTEKLGTKAEVKNLNSFRFAKMALDYEISRQIALLESGGTVVQESRLFNSDTGETASMRSKEHAHDYRYFPEPDLEPLRLTADWLASMQREVPELPAGKRARFVETYGLREYDAQVLTSTRAVSEYFEHAAQVAGDPRLAANWVLGDLLGALKGQPITEAPVSAEHLGQLVALIASNEISGKLAKQIFARMLETSQPPRAVMESEGLKQISDTSSLGRIVDEVLAANPKQVEQFKAGKATVLGFLVGQVMKASKGQANPGSVNELLREKLR